MALFYFFSAEYYSTVCLYNIFFIHWSIDEHVGSFQVLAIMNRAAVNIRVNVSFWMGVLSRYVPGVGLLDHTANLCNFVKNFLTVLHSGGTNLHSYQQRRKASFLSYCLQYLLIVDFLIMAIPIPKKVNAKECSNCHTIALISHASKIMLKILQVGFQ